MSNQKNKIEWSRLGNLKANIWVTAGIVVFFLVILWAAGYAHGLNSKAMRPIDADPATPAWVMGYSVSAPQGGATLQTGGTYRIAWQQVSPSQIVPGKVSLSLIDPASSGSPFIIAKDIPASGSYSWTIPKNLPTAFLGKPRVVAVTGTDSGRHVWTGQSATFAIASSDISTTPVTPTTVNLRERFTLTAKQTVTIKNTVLSVKLAYIDHDNIQCFVAPCPVTYRFQLDDNQFVTLQVGKSVKISKIKATLKLEKVSADGDTLTLITQ